MDNVVFGQAAQWLSGVVMGSGLGIPGASGWNRKADSVFAVVDGNVTGSGAQSRWHRVDAVPSM